MAAPVRVAALRQKLFRFYNAQASSNIIQREMSSLLGCRGATDGQPPAASQSALGSPHKPRPQRRSASQSAGQQEQESRHPWDFKLSPLLAQLILTGSALSFMLYFFVLREESDVDTAIYRPAWERVPGITPEMAERMMEMDKQLGILYDAREWEKSLKEYKQRYYAEHPEARPGH